MNCSYNCSGGYHDAGTAVTLVRGRPNLQALGGARQG